MSGWINPPTPEELKRMADPMSLTFRPPGIPEQGGLGIFCPKCGADNVLEKKRRVEDKRYMRLQRDGLCRVPFECFERAVAARVKALKEKRQTEQGALL